MQNNNESIDLLIFTFVPKHLHSGPKIVEIATYLYAISYNKAFVGVLKAMTTIGNPVGGKTHTYVKKHDESRILYSERHTSDGVKQERIDTRAEQSAFKEFQKKRMIGQSAGIVEKKSVYLFEASVNIIETEKKPHTWQELTFIGAVAEVTRPTRTIV
ncbi:uncharacterized protein TNCV_3517811 [Trichonephila clavipes]|nr:uncharacterized protein TNCV_3517811 [Trichonephila clavipes]